MSVSLQDLANSFPTDDSRYTAPHSMSEFYDVPFSDGSSSTTSGQISLNDFRATGGGLKTVQLTTYTYGTYSDYASSDLLPPVMTSLSQYGYTISGIKRPGGTSGGSGFGVDKAFNRNFGTRAVGNNWDGRLSPGGGWAPSSAYPHGEPTYDGPSTTWTGVGTLTGPWLRVDLPTVKTLIGLVIRPTGTAVLVKKPRLLGSNDGTNWNMVWETDDLIQSPEYSGNFSGFGGSGPNVVLFTPSGSYSKYVFQWLGNHFDGSYLPRICQLNLII